jgi:hypothetical protein
VRRPFDWLAAVHLLLQSVIVFTKISSNKNGLERHLFPRLGIGARPVILNTARPRRVHDAGADP